jgi:hypothetical protein
MCSKGEPVIGPMIIVKAKSFYDEMKVTDKCAFWQEPVAEKDTQDHSSD